MRATRTHILGLFLLLLASIAHDAQGQFVMTWLDIGEMHSRYSEVGAHSEGATENRSVEWPAILRHSGHYRSKSYWIGVKDWVDDSDRFWNYYVAHAGPRSDGAEHFTPITTRLVAKFEDTEVIVDGYYPEDKISPVHEIDPELPADRMLYQKYRSGVGIETERWVYAYAHQTHDDYHIIRRKMTNTGNTDADAVIERADSSLTGVYFHNQFRWTGRQQAAWSASTAQSWGKFSMIDIVGDGHENYPVDFTAIYAWAGYDPEFAAMNWDHLGSPMITPNQWTTAADTTGRLAGISMSGRIVLHADESTTNSTYNQENQPSSLGWTDPDEGLTGTVLMMDRYRLVIKTRENPDQVRGGDSRMYPHYADRVEPSGEFWNPTNDASSGKQGGFTPIISYGPYEMAPGESINIVEAEGAAGISFEAAKHIGETFKASGFDNELLIPFDANGDGIINERPWDYDVYKNGSELLTKNQWFLTARDSIYQFMYRARDVWEASDNMTEYPMVEPPRPPRLFEVNARPELIELQWETISGSEDPESWEIYRTHDYADNLPYELVTSLPGSARRFDDSSVARVTDYYYYLQAVGPANAVDERGITGTPGGKPLKSGRYFTQTYRPTRLTRWPGTVAADFQVVPNPINLASDETLRIFPNGDQLRGQVEFLDIPGFCTISIFTETGELVKRIEHATGSGYNTWDLLTEARQPIVSGIYLIHIADTESGNTATKKLVVIK